MARRGQHEGSIYQRQDGRWAASLTLGYVGGKRKRKTFYGATQREVREQLTAARHAQQQRLPVPNERQTTGQFLTQWLEESAKPTIRPKTYASYAQLIRLHLIPELGRIPLAKLGPQQVQEFLNRKLASGLSPRTVQYLHALLRAALNQALRWGLVARNVATLVDAPRVRRADIAAMRHLSRRVGCWRQCVATGSRRSTRWHWLWGSGSARRSACAGPISTWKTARS